MRVEVRLLGVLLGLWLPAAGLHSQTQPLPTLPPPDEPESARQRPWEYEAGLGVRYDDNIGLLAPAGPSDVAIVPRALLARVFRGPRGQLRAEAGGSRVGYAERGERGRGYADFRLDGAYNSSPRTRLWLNASYALGHTDSSRPLLDQGLVLPLVKTRTLTGALGLSRRLGARTTFSADGRIFRTDFDTPTLFDSQSLRGTLGLERQIGARSAVGLVYAAEHAQATQAGDGYLTHFGSLRWTRTLSARTALLLEAGAGYTPDAARAGLSRKDSFFGGASLRRQVRRSSLSAFVRREVAPAFGTGFSRLEVRTGLNADVPLGRRWEGRVGAVFVRPDRSSDDSQASGADASLALRRSLGRHWALSGETSYRRRGATGALPVTQAFEAGLYLTLSSARRAN